MRGHDTELITRLIHTGINIQCDRLKAEWTNDENGLVMTDLDTLHRYRLDLTPLHTPQEGEPTFGTDHQAAYRHITLRPWDVPGVVSGLCGAHLTLKVSPDANGMTNCPSCYDPGLTDGEPSRS
ncbi:hypothetical protein [Streptomyces sp. TR02-1]|uniref:hypothetical protein n=1 Tax=Streptomyces sp. TR02-1 TaxID=3385977 RepID=UPI0039A22B32